MERNRGIEWYAGGAHKRYCQLLQICMYVYTSCKNPHILVAPVQLMRPGIGQNKSRSVVARSVTSTLIFREMMFFDCSYKCTCTYTHTYSQRVEKAIKELNAWWLAVEMIKEQLRIPDVETGSALSRKDKQG